MLHVAVIFLNRTQQKYPAKKFQVNTQFLHLLTGPSKQVWLG